jgi:hypothetical protein
MLHGFAEDDLAYFPNEKSTTWESIWGICVKLIYIYIKSYYIISYQLFFHCRIGLWSQVFSQKVSTSDLK